MTVLTLNPHEQVAVADIITALLDTSKDQKPHVIQYALAKAIAMSFEHRPIDCMVGFLSDLEVAAVNCHRHPDQIPPEE